jgi:hypothetical protein
MAASWAQQGAAAFDLAGPQVEVKVTRERGTLPIAEVPNLKAGDRVWIHPVLPEDQSARYLMVVVFLRGATNPPPDAWFIRAETWTRRVHEEGVVVTVPAEAQQALILLAPQTGGDFATLRSAVQGKPGAFVRAAQDLQLAGLNRARLEKYLAAIRDADPKLLHERALTLARSLSIKVDEQCFSRPALQQANCLMQNSDQLVLDDGHGQSMVSLLTQGAGSDLLGAISSTRAAGGGAYSPYVGAVVDLARLMENLHTARYQYISALALPQGDELHLRLNSPPSFHKPQSVIVIGLPAVQPAVPQELKVVSPESVGCAQDPHMVLTAEGAPLVFSSELAHHLLLRLEDGKGQSAELPLVANALLGGFTLSSPAPALEWLPAEFSGRVHGKWGFDDFEGPAYKLQRSEAAPAISPAADEGLLVAGHDRSLHLKSAASACVQQMDFRASNGESSKVSWKAAPGGLQAELPLGHAPGGTAQLMIREFGQAEDFVLPLQVYDEACTFSGFALHAGDAEGVLKGSCLGQVEWMELGGQRWLRAGAAAADGLHLRAADGDKLSLGSKAQAKLRLKDGRELEVAAELLAARPRLKLVSKSVEPAESPIQLHSDDDLPVDGRLSFRLRSEQPYARDEKVEVASDDGFYRAELSLENGGLMRQNAHNVLATLAPPHDAAASAFGALRFRPVGGDGVAGDWQPLVTLVRLPELGELHCPPQKDAACELSGHNLFLIDSLSAARDFANPVEVSESEMEPRIAVPHPRGKQLYLKLRDDPAAIHTLELPWKKDPAAVKAEPAAMKDEKPEKAEPAEAPPADPRK